ncbi:MAG: signal peptidase II [Pseudomonadota bacterium]
MTQNSTVTSWLWGHYSRLGLGVALAALVIDQLHKWWMLTIVGITQVDQIKVTPFFNLIYVSNKGISFGLFQQDGSGQLFLAGFAFIVACMLMIWLARSGDSKQMAISIGLVVGGAIGNAIDRLYLGGVADFFDFHVLGYHWPAFNIADTAIVAGVAGLLYDAFLMNRNNAAKGL